MIYILLVFFLIFFIVGFLDLNKIKGFDDFVLAGKKSGSILLAGSLLATVIGASATMGVAGLAYEIGFPAFWWLGSGALGLFLSGMFIVNKLKDYQVYTLADLSGKLFGERVRKLVAAIIVIGWVGVISAQFVAGAKIISGLISLSFSGSLLIISGFLLLYCLLGGQRSVLRTDLIQIIIMIAGILTVLVVLFRISPLTSEYDFSLLNGFGIDKLAYFVLIVGSGYFIGPDVFSRIFTAKGSNEAKKGLFMAAIILFFYSIAITMIGVWAKYNIPDLNGQNVLALVLAQKVPWWVGIFFSFALLSAIISSADTCLLTVSSIVSNDFFKINKVFFVRGAVLVFGLLSLLIAWVSPNIINNLLLAYNVFSCGVIPPMALGLLQKKKLSPSLVMLAMLIGGAFGVIASLTQNNNFALVGVVLSFIISLSAIKD